MLYAYVAERWASSGSSPCLRHLSRSEREVCGLDLLCLDLGQIFLLTLSWHVFSGTHLSLLWEC